LPCFASSASMFLGASAIMIRIAELLRRTEAGSSSASRTDVGGDLRRSPLLRKK
jgi:hypothetical protein